MTARIKEKIEKINEIVRKYRILSISMTVDIINIGRETVRYILLEELNLKCVIMVPKT